MKVIDGSGSGNGFDHDAGDAVVDAAVAAIEREDAVAARWARVAADFMTGGHGAGTIHQARLQEFLWSALPRKFSPDEWAPIVDGTARLLEALGLSRYADIARSDATQAVLEAWAVGFAEGFGRFLEEHRRSGIAPPDTELLEWGELMGMEEAIAFETVSVALEAAIVAGEYQPGARGWRTTAAEITRRTLEEPVRPIMPADLRRYRRIDLVLGSRIEAWVASARGAPHRELRGSVAAMFLDGPAAVEPEPPDAIELEAALAPLSWLLETCRDGVRATATGNLEPAVARAAAERFDWWPFDDQPRGEGDVPQLVRLHQIATRNRWLLRRSRRIRTTKPALALLDDPIQLWWAATGTAGQTDEYLAMVSELLALRLLDGPAEFIGHMVGDRFGVSELALAVAEGLLPQGWQSGNLALTEWDVDRDIHEPLREWRLFGFLDEPPITREALEQGRPTVKLSPVGRHAALALLYTRATASREIHID